MLQPCNAACSFLCAYSENDLFACVWICQRGRIRKRERFVSLIILLAALALNFISGQTLTEITILFLVRCCQKYHSSSWNGGVCN